MKKFGNELMLVLLIAAVFIYYTEMIPIKVDAVTLAASYSKNKTASDSKFLDKELKVTGTIKAFYKLVEIGNVLELNTNDSDISLFCFFVNEIDEKKAAMYSEGDTVIVTGKCKGLEKYNLVNGVKIEVKKIN